MSNALKALTRGAADPLYVDDVFSTYLYTGNGSTQTITNGIDLAGKGGLVWTKCRTQAYNPQLTDTANGAGTYLQTTDTDALSTGNTIDAIQSFSSTGFSLANGWFGNKLNETYVSWTFRRAPKFFDVVTYTGNGVAGRQIAHSLGVSPGMIIIKRTDNTGNWGVYHRSLPNDGNGVESQSLLLNSTTNAGGYGMLDIHANQTSTYFQTRRGSAGDWNINTATYVAYLFAHDTASDGIIQCGSFTTDGSGNATVNHGWTAGVQFAAIKASSTSGDWEMYDTARTAGWSGNDARLRANLSNAEDSVARLSASGTSISFAGLSASATYIYVFVVAPT